MFSAGAVCVVMCVVVWLVCMFVDLFMFEGLYDV